MCRKYQCSGNRDYCKNRVIQETSHCSGNRDLKHWSAKKDGPRMGCSGNGNGRGMEIQPSILFHLVSMRISKYKSPNVHYMQNV
uniref:Uncharacterized protein n=1 Tax=Romanomermis culicivorax TaxID=13658 RepID=A0A915JR48_ROMCU